MKKNYIAISLLATLWMAGDGRESGYKVGGKMPDLSGSVTRYEEFWRDYDFTKVGVVALLSRNRSTFKAFYTICNGGRELKPFAVLDDSSGTLLVDNNPTDGTIDKVVSYSQLGDRKITDDAPLCEAKLFI